MTSLQAGTKQVQIEILELGGGNFVSWEKGIKEAITSSQPRLVKTFTAGYPDITSDGDYTLTIAVIDVQGNMEQDVVRARLVQNTKNRQTFELAKVSASEIVKKSMGETSLVLEDAEFVAAYEGRDYLRMIEVAKNVTVGNRSQAMAEAYPSMLRNLQWPSDDSLDTLDQLVRLNHRGWARLRLVAPDAATEESMTRSYLQALPTDRFATFKAARLAALGNMQSPMKIMDQQGPARAYAQTMGIRTGPLKEERIHTALVGVDTKPSGCCYRCGEKGHIRRLCKAGEVECTICKKEGKNSWSTHSTKAHGLRGGRGTKRGTRTEGNKGQQGQNDPKGTKFTALIRSLQGGTIKGTNCEASDLRAVRKRFGPCQACLMGKITQDPSPTSTSPDPPLATSLHIDLLFIRAEGGRKAPFMVAVEPVSGVAVIRRVSNRSASELSAVILQIADKFNERSKTKIAVVRTDPEPGFVASENALLAKGIRLVTVPAKRHVRMAERVIRELKDLMRTVLADLEFRLPLKLYPFLLDDVAMTRNVISHRGRDKSPREILTGNTVDVDIDFMHRFGSVGYTRATEFDKMDDLDPRAELAVIVGHYLGEAGAVMVWLVATGSVCKRNSFKPVPLTEDIIQTINRTTGHDQPLDLDDVVRYVRLPEGVEDSGKHDDQESAISQNDPDAEGAETPSVQPDSDEEDESENQPGSQAEDAGTQATQQLLAQPAGGPAPTSSLPAPNPPLSQPADNTHGQSDHLSPLLLGG